MKIKCGNCRATYNVASDKIPAKGKKVKCTNCGSMWLFLPPISQGIPEEKKVKKGGHSKKRDSRSLLGNVALVAVMLPLMFMFSAVFQKNVPYEFRKMYRFMEVYDTSNVKLVESGIKVVGTDDQEIVAKVSWVIENTGHEDRFIPNVYFLFYDKNAKRVFSHKFAVNKYKLIPGNTSIKFEKTIGGIPRNVDTMKVKAGNAFEILFH